MTCVSLRSGIASSDMFRADHQPAMTAAAVKRKTRKGLFADHSMTRLIIGSRPRVHLTLGIEQEVAGCDDPLAGLQPFEDLDAIAESRASFHFPWLQVAAAEVYKDSLRAAP